MRFLVPVSVGAVALGAAIVGVTTAPAGAAPGDAPGVTVAADVREALGVDTLLMTPAQRDAAGLARIDRNQDVLADVSARIGLDETGRYPRGFAGFVENPATSTITLWWNGAVPSAVRTAAPAGVELQVRDAPYSRNQLLEVIESHRTQMTGVDLAFPRTDGTGIVLSHAPGTAVDAEAIARLVGVPVTVVASDPLVDVTGGRQADVSPHNGGALIVHGTHICSTAFAVLAGVEGRLLSAAHCDTSGDWAWNNGSGTQLTPGGSAVSVALSVDSMLINPNGGTSGYIYTGGYNSSNRTAVAGTATNNIGELVATGGGNSGEHRGLTITNDAYPSTCNGYSCTLILAEGDPGQTVVVGGDSGGPVYHTLSDGRVNAKGVILKGGSQLTTCAAMRYSNPCYNVVAYQPIRPLLNGVWNVSIETHS